MLVRLAASPLGAGTVRRRLCLRRAKSKALPCKPALCRAVAGKGRARPAHLKIIFARQGIHINRKWHFSNRLNLVGGFIINKK
jgi:hypothetical protein